MGEALKRVTSTPTDAATNDAGPAIDTVVLAVPSMHCGLCIAHVERSLQELPGVLDARANLSTRRVRITYERGRVEPDDFKTALDKRGFETTELGDASEPAHAAEARDLLQRLAVAGFAAMNVMLLSVSVWSGGASGDMDHAMRTLFHWLSAGIALPAVAYAGQPFFRSAARGLRARQLNMDVPISLGVILATGMSLIQTIRGQEHVFFDAAVMLLAFLLLGRYLDQTMRTRAAGAAANLLRVRAPTATLIALDGTTTRVPVEALGAGQCVIVAAGERQPADGIVVSGTSAADESVLTGETLPRTLTPGTAVHAGTINLLAPLTVRVTAPHDKSLIAEIAQLMTAAEQHRGHYVRLADRAAKLYAPAVHVLGFLTLSGWLLAGQGWEQALLAAIAVLIITCPCALALAVPAVQVAASSRLFENGVLVKAPDGLERLAEIDTVVFDKTGTLTMGEPQLVNSGEISDDDLALAASLAQQSRHPYSRAIVAAAKARGLSVPARHRVVEQPGLGLEDIHDERRVRLGSRAWTGGPDSSAAGQDTAVWLAEGDRRPVLFRFEDALRPDARETVARLRQAGFAVELLSGDREEAVARAADATGIRAAYSARDPAQKIAHLEDLKSAGRKALMVGDGLNDAPALAAAHASLSPATAADISQTASDAVFQTRSVAAVTDLLATSRAAQRLAVQNFWIAIVYNLLFVPLAMAGLVTPLIAALAMSFSSITVVANALRLKKRNLRLEK
ncbi:MAG: heavy metal translocating P-type ATPase [Hyphomicrobium sp.]|nr:heavy metal translocating P-type ATPase [Hyphomicrobium sp.]